MSRPRYDIINATFYFFKVFRRRPLGVIWIGFWQILVNFAFWGLLLFSDFYLRFIGEFAAVCILYIGSSVLFLMMQGAWLRLLVRDEIAPIIPLRLGSDELKLLGINLSLITILSIPLILFLAYSILFFSNHELISYLYKDNFNIIIYITAPIIFITISSLIPHFLIFLNINPIIILLLGAITIILNFVIININNFGMDPIVFYDEVTVITGVTICGALFSIILIFLGLSATSAFSVRQKGPRVFASFAVTRGMRGKMFLSYLLVLVLMSLASWLVGAISLFILSLWFGLASLLSPLWVGLWHGVGAYVAIRYDSDLEVKTLALPPA